MDQQQFDDTVIAAYTSPDGKKPILDGIVNKDIFSKTSPKILWVLKEPYDKGDGLGGWALNLDVDENVRDYFFRFPTWRKVGYISYCILNKMTYEEATSKPDVFEVLKAIAHINVSKCPGGTSSSGQWKNFAIVYDKCRHILLKQIKQCNPDIIIMGNVGHLFITDLKLEANTQHILPLMKKGYYKSNTRLIINAYHPANRMKQANYCNEIINTALDWFNNK